MKLIIIGSGGAGAEVASYIEEINLLTPGKIALCGFIDDSYPRYLANAAKYALDAPYAGTIEGHEYLSDHEYVMAFSDPQKKLELTHAFNARGVKMASIIHPSTKVARSAVIAKGNIIGAFCLIGPNAIVGENNLITSYSFVSHDCVIGKCNFLSSAGLSGHVEIGDGNFFGIRATVIPHIKIGSLNTVQAGMIVDKDVSNSETLFYRFKEKISVIDGRSA